jgi:hypothetical protein
MITTLAAGSTLLLGVILLAVRARPPAPPPFAAPARIATLIVRPLQVMPPGPRVFEVTAFADSLAARLGRIGGLSARVASHAGSEDFVVDGQVTLQHQRLVITARLRDQSTGEIVWTSTIWRADAPDEELASDVAADVAEALYGHLARRAVTTGARR